MNSKRCGICDSPASVEIQEMSVYDSIGSTALKDARLCEDCYIKYGQPVGDALAHLLNKLEPDTLQW